MQYVGEPIRIAYTALSFAEGLIDVTLYVKKPDDTVEGPLTLVEMVHSSFKGIYEIEYRGADIEGEYIFVVDSASSPKKFAKNVTFKTRPVTRRPSIIFMK